mgnify:CR=1 FL=1
MTCNLDGGDAGASMDAMTRNVLAGLAAVAAYLILALPQTGQSLKPLGDDVWQIAWSWEHLRRVPAGLAPPGMTPTTVRGSPPSCSVLPTIEGSAPSSCSLPRRTGKSSSVSLDQHRMSTRFAVAFGNQALDEGGEARA